jgi:hypothetical protein
MAQQVLEAESAHELLQPARLFELAVHHPLLALTATLWIAVAYACAAIATRKNRDDQLWGFLGILFSVLTLVVLVALPSTRPNALSATRI